MRGLPSINKAMVTLLPIVDGALDIKDFRPVSLVHGAIKNFDKVLACRVAEDLPALVGNHQSAFVKGRSIHDNFMLVQCMARRLHAVRQPTVMLKLDITKAFDTVQWAFLLEILQAMGFGPRWRAWIYGLLGSCSTRILVNGMAGKPIFNYCGLRQGAPLSPMLFILVMEPLHRMFELAAARRVLAPLASNGLKQRLSMFADDVMLFVKPNEMDLQACALILHLFGEASGLKVNLAKSVALPIRCDDEMMLRVQSVLGCAMGTYPCKYLGLPLMIRKQTATQLMSLVDGIARCLPRWRAANMPKSGRMLLVKSVLCAMPLHAMLALDILQKIITAITKIRRGFLWSASDKAIGGQCAVAWEKVCTPRWAGGLGLPNLKWMNIALHARWPWLQRTDSTRPWAEFQIEVPEASRLLCAAASHSLIGDGCSTLFWEDRWLDGNRVQDIAPNIFATIRPAMRAARTVLQALSEGSWISDVGSDLSGQMLGEYHSLWAMLSTVQLSQGTPETITWSWEPDGNFTCK